MELNQLTRILFQDKQSYEHIDPIEKERLFFIFNRIITRGIVNTADALNRKGIDTSLAMDVWFNYAKNTTKTPTWFSINWGKLKKGKDESVLKKYDYIDKWILSHYPEAIEQEKQRISFEKEDVIEIKKNKKTKKKNNKWNIQ